MHIILFLLILAMIWAFVRVTGALIYSILNLLIVILTTPWLLCLSLAVLLVVLFH